MQCPYCDHESLDLYQFTDNTTVLTAVLVCQHCRYQELAERFVGNTLIETPTDWGPWTD